jgi:hypothetical protein
VLEHQQVTLDAIAILMGRLTLSDGDKWLLDAALRLDLDASPIGWRGVYTNRPLTPEECEELDRWNAEWARKRQSP